MRTQLSKKQITERNLHARYHAKCQELRQAALKLNGLLAEQTALATQLKMRPLVLGVTFSPARATPQLQFSFFSEQVG